MRARNPHHRMQDLSVDPAQMGSLVVLVCGHHIRKASLHRA